MDQLRLMAVMQSTVVIAASPKGNDQDKTPHLLLDDMNIQLPWKAASYTCEKYHNLFIKLCAIAMYKQRPDHSQGKWKCT